MGYHSLNVHMVFRTNPEQPHRRIGTWQNQLICILYCMHLLSFASVGFFASFPKAKWISLHVCLALGVFARVWVFTLCVCGLPCCFHRSLVCCTHICTTITTFLKANLLDFHGHNERLGMFFLIQRHTEKTTWIGFGMFQSLNWFWDVSIP